VAKTESAVGKPVVPLGATDVVVALFLIVVVDFLAIGDTSD
jgi:hypothetical protein